MEWGGENSRLQGTRVSWRITVGASVNSWHASTRIDRLDTSSQVGLAKSNSYSHNIGSHC